MDATSFGGRRGTQRKNSLKGIPNIHKENIIVRSVKTIAVVANFVKFAKVVEYPLERTGVMDRWHREVGWPVPFHATMAFPELPPGTHLLLG